MAGNKTVMAILFVCDMRRAYGTPSVAARYPALKRWARMRRPLRGLCFLPVPSLRDLSPHAQQPSTYVLGYRDNVASRLGKNKTPTSAKNGQMWGTFRFLVPSLRDSSRHAKEPSTYVLGYRDNVASRLGKNKIPHICQKRADVGHRRMPRGYDASAGTSNWISRL